MNIEKIVNDQTVRLVESGELEKMIAENVESAIRKVVTDKFGGYSFQRDLEKKLSKEMDPLLNEISFSGYRDVIIDRIKKILTGLVDVDLVEKAEKAYKDIFILTDKPLKMSEFFEIVRKEYLNEEPDSYGKCFKVEIEDDERSDSFRHITIQFSENDNYSADNEFKIMSHEKGSFFIYSLKTENLSYKKDNKILLKVQYLKTFERILLNAYISDQPIIMDIESVDDIDCSRFDGDY